MTFILGNLAGFIFVAALFFWGTSPLLSTDNSLVHSGALAKITAPITAVFFRGILCNWLVYLAILVANLVEGSAKFITIWWCLLAFIACIYEHSVANMTLFALSWFGNHSESYTLLGICHNLLWVSLRNLVSGTLLLGLGYWYAIPKANRLK